LRAVIDTNVFVSGVFWSGTPKQILKHWVDRKFELILTEEIIEEYRDVLYRLSKKVKQIDVDKTIQLVTFYGHLHEPVKLPSPISRDPDDDKFIAAAISGDAKMIVSGDQDLLVLKEYGAIKLITAKSFLQLI
jgi:uncharacterized protein